MGMTNPVYTRVQDTADQNSYFVTFFLTAHYTTKKNKLLWQTCCQIFPCMRLHRTSHILSEGGRDALHAPLSFHTRLLISSTVVFLSLHLSAIRFEKKNKGLTTCSCLIVHSSSIKYF